MIKIYYGGWDPEDHSNATSFAVASMTFRGPKLGEKTKKFLDEHPEFFEIGLEIGGRKFTLNTGVSIKPIQF